MRRATLVPMSKNPEPPIVEGACELSLAGVGDATQAALADGLLADLGAELDRATDGTRGVVRMFGPDKGDIVQVGRDFFIVNRTRPYTGWSAFRARIFRVVECVRRHDPQLALSGITLRFMNLLPADENGMVKEKVNIPVPLIPNLSRKVQGFTTHTTMDLVSPPGVLQVLFATGSVDELGEGLLLDVGAEPSEGVAWDSLGELLDGCHAALLETFRACTTSTEGTA